MGYIVQFNESHADLNFSQWFEEYTSTLLTVMNRHPKRPNIKTHCNVLCKIKVLQLDSFQTAFRVPYLWTKKKSKSHSWLYLCCCSRWYSDNHVELEIKQWQHQNHCLFQYMPISTARKWTCCSVLQITIWIMSLHS